MQVCVKLPAGSVAPKLADSRLGTFAQPAAASAGGAAALQASYSASKEMVVASGGDATTPEVGSSVLRFYPSAVSM